MNPNDFDLNTEARWKRAIHSLQAARTARERFAGKASISAEEFDDFLRYEQAAEALLADLGHLADTGVLSAITDNLPMTLGRVV